MATLIGIGCQEAFSQTENGRSSIDLEDIAFSFRGGLGVSNLAGSTAGYSYHSGIALLGGIYAEYNATPKSGLMTGIEWGNDKNRRCLFLRQSAV